MSSLGFGCVFFGFGTSCSVGFDTGILQGRTTGLEGSPKKGHPFGMN